MQFELIYDSYSPKIFRLCMGYVNDHERAKDLLQETFIQVWKNLHTFRNESSIGTWIFRIATNICLRQIELDSRMKTTEVPFQVTDNSETKIEDQLAILYKCISTLREFERVIISLVLEDLPQKEIAEITGISEGNLRVKIHRIKQALTERFNEYARL